MSSAAHRIHSQKWFLRADSVEEAMDARRQIHKQLDTVIPGIFEKVLDGISPNGEITHIPRLELTLKISSLKKLNEELPGLLEKELSEKLQEVMASYAGKISGKENQTEITINGNKLRDAIFYLRYGTMPWYIQQESVSGSLGSITELILEIQPQLIAHILQKTEEPTFYFRLFQLFTPENGIRFTSELAQKGSQLWNDELVTLLDRLTNDPGIITPSHIRLKIASVILYEILHSKNSQGKPDLYQAVFREVIQRGNLDVDPETEAILKELQNWNLTTRFSSPEKAFERGTGIDFSRETEESEHTETSISELNKTGLSEPANETKSIPSLSPEEKDLEGLQKQPISRDPLQQAERRAVFHAGIIILHPFIQRLFAATGITEAENPVIPFQLLPKAAALLHYLATGSEDVFEFELGLIKVMLGLEPGFPLPVASGLLNSQDKEESEELLHSAISHWSILKDTSIPGFQGTFIQRRGILVQHEENWNLHIERTSYDLLLEYLPWSISIVKLPWMTQPIFTEW